MYLSITLSCYRFKEGTTVPEWHGVVMLDDGRSAEEYLQAIFRSQSPARKGEEKDNCYVFDFNPQRLLSIYHDIAQWNSKDGKEPQFELVKQFLKYAPILQDDGNKMSPVDAKEIIENFRLHGSFSEKMANERVFNYDYIKNVLDEDIATYIEGISPKKNATEIQINTHDLEKAKNAISKKVRIDGGGGDDEDEEEVNLEIQKEKIRNILRRLPTFLFASEFAEKGVEDIIKTKEPSIFEEICGVPPEFLKKLIDKKIISARILNETIGYFHDVIDQIEVNPTLESAESFFKQHLVMHGEESSTPASIVNEMLDKLPKEIWGDKNKTFLDPVCGTGKFLIGIYERLMDGLKSSITNEEERSKWIIENMIYGYDNVKHKVIMARKLLGNKPYNYNIDVEDTLEKDWKGMKFDVVVGNPPYFKNLHLDFLKIAYNISKRFIIWVHPSAWIIDEREKNNDIKELIKNNIIDLKIFNGNPIFNVALYYPFVITSIDKEINNSSIKVISTIMDNEEDFNSIYDINKWNNLSVYPTLRDKILKLSQKDNLRNHRNKNIGDYFVSVPRIRGHGNVKDPKKIWEDDFYTFFPKDEKIGNKPRQENFFSFKTEKEANNFMEFLKTRWAAFSLSILKISSQASSGVFEPIPWLDWSKPWAEEDFEKLINATPEEIEFVHKNIPNYYNI